MNYNYYKDIPIEYNDFLKNDYCFMSPALSALQEVVLLQLKEIAFYLLELKQLGAHNEKIKENILEALSGIVIDVEYDEEHYQNISRTLFEILAQVKIVYGELCKKDSVEPKVFKTYFKQTKKMPLVIAIKKGEKYIIKRSKLLSVEQKRRFEILFFLLKSICAKIFELKNLGKDKTDAQSLKNELFREVQWSHDYEDAYFEILSMLTAMTLPNLSAEEEKKLVEKYIMVYYNLVNKVYSAQVKIYGEGAPVEVSLSTRKGKAILVAGGDFKELEMVLKASEGKNIDVYTHGVELLMAHTFPKFREYNHLVGHFGRGADASLIDFANFPGPVFMTRHSLYKTQNIYRAIVFTTDAIPPKGAVKIVNNNFEPLIKSALSAKGFSKATERGKLKAGYEEKEISRKIREVLDQVEGEKLKKICFFGLLNAPAEQSNYFEKLFALMPKDSFIFSLSYKYSGENIYHVDSFYDYSLIYKILTEIKERKMLETIDVVVFITRCDKYTVSNILTLKQMGVKKIYMCKCSPMLVSPALLCAIKSFFGVEEFVDPIQMLEKVLGGRSERQEST